VAKATDCKSVISGSSPDAASTLQRASVVVGMEGEEKRDTAICGGEICRGGCVSADRSGLPGGGSFGEADRLRRLGDRGDRPGRRGWGAIGVAGRGMTHGACERRAHPGTC
jgi:hypothetical protein